MHDKWKDLIWLQFGASIDSIKSSIELCPDALWSDQSREPQYWYLAFHTIFWLDFYMEDSSEGYYPPEPFGLEELDPAGLLPPRVYSKQELLAFLAHARANAKQALHRLTEEASTQSYHFANTHITVAEKFLYNMRHCQHHAAQMNLIMRQADDSAPGWVFQAKDQL